MSRFVIRYQRHLRSLCSLQQQAASLHQFHLHDHTLPIPTDAVFIKSKYAPLVTAHAATHIADTLQSLELAPEEVINCKVFINSEIRSTLSSKYDQVPHFQGLASLASQVGQTKILVVAELEYHKEALAAGATKVITADNIEDIGLGGKININNYDQVICTENCLRGLQSKGKILQNKMPHKRKGTVTQYMSSTIDKILKTVNWETVQCPSNYFTYTVDINFARADSPSDDISTSLHSVINSIIKYMPANGVGDFIRRVEIHASGDTMYFDHTTLTEGQEVVQEADVSEARPDLHDREVLRACREEGEVWAQEVLQGELEVLARELEERWSVVQGIAKEG